MSSGLTDAWADMRRIITTAWPDTTVIFRVPQIERVDWKNVLMAAKTTMQPPYAILAWSTSQAENVGGMSRDVWQVPVTIIRVVKISSGDSTGDLEDSMTDLLTELRRVPGSTGAPTDFLVMDQGMAMDVTENNPVTRTFLGQQLPLQAGSLTMQIMVPAL